MGDTVSGYTIEHIWFEFEHSATHNEHDDNSDIFVLLI